MKARLISTLMLLMTAIFIIGSAQAENQSTAMPETSIAGSTTRLDASEPVIYDLGSRLAVVFYYTDSKGDRLLVTTIGPKDPDSEETATQQIVKMESDGKVVVNIDSDKRISEPMQLSAHFEGSDLVVAFNKV